MAKRRRISHHAVGASLSPESMRNYINEWYDEQNQRQQSQQGLDELIRQDPLERLKIGQEYGAARTGREHDLAARGLSAGGYTAGDLGDIERSRMNAEAQQNAKLEAARSQHNALMQTLNNRRTQLDAQYALEAGANIKAGTGKYKHEKPKGWVPPNLAGTPPAPKPAAPATLGNAPASASTPTTKPTGARLTPPGAPKPGRFSLGSIAKNRQRLAGIRGRVRLA